MNEEQRIKAQKEIDKFIFDFRNKWGTAPNVKVNFDKKVPTMSLIELETLVNMEFESVYPSLYGNEFKGIGIRYRRRNKEVLTFRNIYFKYGIDYNYTLGDIGEHIGFNHSTVLHGSRRINNSKELWHKTLIERVQERIKTYLEN